ncbi:hypothetical protein DdX_16110 [Ditylenchus destructor]|uniref:Uncharacterized protein n=1 Tax=Ditylenchus destructor TaxID=166010 RepID=A0AAD4MQZ1_9BILA|nr:hypothetical protein DdX_16110 [Ditylenchus destructor]
MNSAVLSRLLFAVCLLGAVVSQDPTTESTCGIFRMRCNPKADPDTCCPGLYCNDRWTRCLQIPEGVKPCVKENKHCHTFVDCCPGLATRTFQSPEDSPIPMNSRSFLIYKSDF